jgi:hypothetical protein
MTGTDQDIFLRSSHLQSTWGEEDADRFTWKHTDIRVQVTEGPVCAYWYEEGAAICGHRSCYTITEENGDGFQAADYDAFGG